jgi:hypothetical protein
MTHAQKLSKSPGGGKAPPKGKKAVASGKKVEDEREEALQAVVWIPVLQRNSERGYGKVLIVYRFLRTHSKQDSILLHWRHQE